MKVTNTYISDIKCAILHFDYKTTDVRLNSNYIEWVECERRRSCCRGPAAVLLLPSPLEEKETTKGLIITNWIDEHTTPTFEWSSSGNNESKADGRDGSIDQDGATDQHQHQHSYFRLRDIWRLVAFLFLWGSADRRWNIKWYFLLQSNVFNELLEV